MDYKKPGDYDKDVFADTATDSVAGANQYTTGWSSTTPPQYQFENFAQNRQDKFLSHLNKYGIAQWDNATAYPAGAYVGYDERIYIASIANSNKQPDTQTADWALIDNSIRPTIKASGTLKEFAVTAGTSTALALATPAQVVTALDIPTMFPDPTKALTNLNNIPPLEILTSTDLDKARQSGRYLIFYQNPAFSPFSDGTQECILVVATSVNSTFQELTNVITGVTLKRKTIDSGATWSAWVSPSPAHVTPANSTVTATNATVRSVDLVTFPYIQRGTLNIVLTLDPAANNPNGHVVVMDMAALGVSGLYSAHVTYENDYLTKIATTFYSESALRFKFFGAINQDLNVFSVTVDVGLPNNT